MEPKVHYRVHKIMSQINNFTSYYFNININIILPSMHISPRWYLTPSCNKLRTFRNLSLWEQILDIIYFENCCHPV